MESKRVYIVIEYCFETGKSLFRNVFFNRNKAEKWIEKSKRPQDFEIETYEQQEDGTSKEIRDYGQSNLSYD